MQTQHISEKALAYRWHISYKALPYLKLGKSDRYPLEAIELLKIKISLYLAQF